MSSQTEVRPVLLGGRLRLALRVILSISVSLFGVSLQLTSNVAQAADNARILVVGDSISQGSSGAADQQVGGNSPYACLAR